MAFRLSTKRAFATTWPASGKRDQKRVTTVAGALACHGPWQLHESRPFSGATRACARAEYPSIQLAKWAVTNETTIFRQFDDIVRRFREHTIAFGMRDDWSWPAIGS